MKHHCTRCGEVLNEAKAVWLELDTRTGTYTAQPVPDEHSQGGFIFGAACAKREQAKHATAWTKRNAA